MAHLLKYKTAGEYEWFDGVMQMMFKTYTLNSFKWYSATKVLQKYARGFIVRRFIKKLHEAATVIQKHWRGYMIRIHLVRYSKIRYIEAQEEYYNKMAGKIQKAWHAYVCRNDPYAGTVKFFTKINEANSKIVDKMRVFYNEELQRTDDELIAGKKKWLNFALPKLHHLIRTKFIPGIYSINGTYDYSLIENLLLCYDFSNFSHELKLERKKCVEVYQEIEPTYQLEGCYTKCEKVYKERLILKEPKL